MKVVREGKATLGALERLGDAARDSAKSFTPSGWKAASAAAKDAAAERGVARELAKEAAENPGFFKSIGNGIKWVFMSPLKLGVWAVEQPVALAMKPFKWSVNGMAAAFEKAPRATPVLLAAGAAVTGAHFLAKRNAKKLEAQAEAIDQMQLLQASQPQPVAIAGPQAVAALPAPANDAPVSYKNSASQADVDAKIAEDRANGKAPGSQTAALAARTAMTPPEAASAGPAI